MSETSETAEEVTESFGDLAKQLIAPISDAAPCGEDPKYSNEFELAKAQITSTSGRDFEVVRDNCFQILTKQAKDLPTLCYYTAAVSQTDGIGAFSESLSALDHLLKSCWDDVFPQRERGRMNALKWLNEERTLGTVAKLKPVAGDRESLETAQKALESLRELTFEKFPDSPPSIKGLVKLVEDWLKEIPKEQKPAEEAQATKSTPSQPTQSAGTAPSATSAPASVESKEDFLKTLQKAAFFILQSEPTNALGYRLLRMVKWGEVKAPPRNDNGKTMFPPPKPQRVSYFESLYQAQNWQEILQKSETVITEPGLLFWLDLQFWVTQALRGTGAIDCAAAVEAELSTMLQRVPDLVGMSFQDGTPFASAMTREWVDTLATAEGSGGGGVGPVSAAVTESSLADDLEKAQDLMKQQKTDQAVALIQSGLEFGNLRDRSERRLIIARFYYQSGNYQMSLLLLEQLHQLIIEKALHEWAPVYAADVFELQAKAASAYMREKGTEESEQAELQKLVRESIRKLSSTDPLRASGLKLN